MEDETLLLFHESNRVDCSKFGSEVLSQDLATNFRGNFGNKECFVNDALFCESFWSTRYHSTICNHCLSYSMFM